MKKRTPLVLFCILVLTVLALQNPTNQSAATAAEPPTAPPAANIATNIPATARSPVPPEHKPVWRVLVLIYDNTDVDYVDDDGVQQHLTISLEPHEKQMAMWSFRQAASIAHDFSDDEAIIAYDIVHVARPITTISLIGGTSQGLRGEAIQHVNGRPMLAPVSSTRAADSHSYWVSPDDSQPELDTYAPPGKYDSIFIHWAQCDLSPPQMRPFIWLGMGFTRHQLGKWRDLRHRHECGRLALGTADGGRSVAA